MGSPADGDHEDRMGFFEPVRTGHSAWLVKVRGMLGS